MSPPRIAAPSALTNMPSYQKSPVAILHFIQLLYCMRNEPLRTGVTDAADAASRGSTLRGPTGTAPLGGTLQGPTAGHGHFVGARR